MSLRPMLCVACAIGLLLLMSVGGIAQEAKPAASQAELIKKLEQDLTGAKLTGSYTIAGREEQSPRGEEYTITSAVKLTEGDMWLLKARVKYGDKDTTVPIPLEIKWAGDTPVITLTDLAIPGLGTFTSRVVLYDDRYAGTWQHGKIGGHLFGKIERAQPEKAGGK